MEAAVNGGDVEKKVNGASKRKRSLDEDGIPLPYKRCLVDVDSTDSDSQKSSTSAAQPSDCNNMSDISRADSNSQLVHSESQSCAENDIHSFDKSYDSPEDTVNDSSIGHIEGNATSSDTRSFDKCFNHTEAEADGTLTDDSKQSFDSSADLSKVVHSPLESSEDQGNTSNPSADKCIFDKCFDGSMVADLGPSVESQSSTKCSDISENESTGEGIVDLLARSDSQSSDKCLNISDTQIDKSCNSSQSFDKCLGSSEVFRRDLSEDHLSSVENECFKMKDEEPKKQTSSIHGQSGLTFSECLKLSEYQASNETSDSLAKCTTISSDKNKMHETLHSNTDRSEAHIELTFHPNDNKFNTDIDPTLIPICNSPEANVELLSYQKSNRLETLVQSDTIAINECIDDKTQLTSDPSAVSSDTIEGYASPIADSCEAAIERSLEHNFPEVSKKNLHPDIDTIQSLPKCVNSFNEKGIDILDPYIDSSLSCGKTVSFGMCLDASNTKSNEETSHCDSTGQIPCSSIESQVQAEKSSEGEEELKSPTKGSATLSPATGDLPLNEDVVKPSAEELAARGEELFELGSGSLEAAELLAAARRGSAEAEGRDGQEEYAQYLGLTPTVKFRCSRCSVATFETLQRLQSHQSRGGCSRPAGAATTAGGTNFRITRKVYLCSACGTYYEHSELFLHMRQEHARHICLFCLSMYISAEKLSAHLCARHEASGDAVWLPHACFLECVGCERVFSETDDFTCHACQPNEPHSKAFCPIETAAVQSSESAENVTHLADTQSSEVLAKQPLEGTSPRFAEDFAGEPSEDLAMSQPSVLDELKPSASRLQMALEAKHPEEKNINLVKGTESSAISPVSSVTSPVPGLKGYLPSVASPVSTLMSPTSLRSSGTSIQESQTPCLQGVPESRFPGTVEPSIADVLGLQADEAVIMPSLLSPSSNASPVSSANADSVKAARRRPKRPRRRAAPRKRKPPPKQQPREPEPEVVALAGREAPLLPLPAVTAEPASQLLRSCVLAAAAGCVYCNHARLIAVCARQLLLHLLAEHRFLPAEMPSTVPADKPRLDSRSEDMDVDVCLSPVKVKEEERMEEPGAEADEDEDEATLARKEADAMQVSMWLKAALPGAESWHVNADTFDSQDDAAGKTWDGSYECFHCHLQVRQHKELYLHNRKLHQKTCLLCVMCKRNFYSYSELLCHLCPGLYVPGALPAGFRCPLCCRGDLPSAFRLMVHMRREHHACDVCLVTTGDQPRLQAHVWKHKLAHVCLRCGIAYRNKPDITKHLFWKHGTESAACRRCLQKKWPHVYHFCQPPQNFVCEDCPRRFSRAVALRVHRRVHSSAPLPYACTECEERVASRRLLARHAVKHETPPPPPPEPELPPEPPSAPTPPPPATSSSPPPVEQSRKKSRKSKQKAPVVDVYDLPPLNLSSDSDSDGEQEPAVQVGDSVVQAAETVQTTDPADEGSIAPDTTQKKKTSEERAEDGELPVPDAVPSVWDDFRQYKARLEAERERTPAEQLEAVLADHDYCVGVPGGPPVPTSADTDHDYCSPTKGATASPAPAEPIPPPLLPAPVEPLVPAKQARSSSSSSSSSSTSKSCGPDCSCSSSSSTDSSSDSSTREGRQRQEGRRKNRKLRILPVLPPTEELPPVGDQVLPQEPDEEAERESDLDTSEPETDEEFYDTHPALATGLPRGAATPAAPPGTLGLPASHNKKRKHRRHTKSEVPAESPLLPLPPGVKRRPKPKRFFGDSDEEAAILEQPPPPVVAPPPMQPVVARVPPIVIMAAPIAVTPPSSDSEDEPALVIASPSPPPVPPPAPVAATATTSGGTGSNLFCYCQCPYDEVSEMIACDGAACHIEWFHFECVGIMVPPQGKWFCPDCRRDNDAR